MGASSKYSFRKYLDILSSHVGLFSSCFRTRRLCFCFFLFGKVFKNIFSLDYVWISFGLSFGLFQLIIWLYAFVYYVFLLNLLYLYHFLPIFVIEKYVWYCWVTVINFVLQQFKSLHSILLYAYIYCIDRHWGFL